MGSFCKVPHNLRDHLGSVRAVVDASTGAVIERNDYLPFGQRRTTVNTTSETASGSNASPNRWFFSGKESQSFLSAYIPLLDFGARMYDPATARWTSIDPMAEKYYGMSPYIYCANSPINLVDTKGMDWYSITESNGKVMFHYDDNIFSQRDLDKARINGKYIGARFKDGNAYYSLFGQTVEYYGINGKPTFEGQLYERLDNLIIKYYTQQITSQTIWDTELPEEPKENFYFSNLASGEYSIQYNGSYEGEAFNSTKSGSIFHSRDKAHSQLKIYQMPPDVPRRYGGYGLGYGEDEWYGCFLILTNGMRDHTLHINYTPQNAKLLKSAINKQFKKK